MRWEEKSSENCVLTLDESDLPVLLLNRGQDIF